MDQMLSKEPQKPGRGLDRASLIRAREKARPEETMAWPGSGWARPVFQASDIGNISVTARGQKSFVVAVSQDLDRISKWTAILQHWLWALSICLKYADTPVHPGHAFPETGVLIESVSLSPFEETQHGSWAVLFPSYPL